MCVRWLSLFLILDLKAAQFQGRFDPLQFQAISICTFETAHWNPVRSFSQKKSLKTNERTGISVALQQFWMN